VLLQERPHFWLLHYARKHPAVSAPISAEIDQ
jgi:hypothetical protein